jgi:hypothetical protein
MTDIPSKIIAAAAKSQLVSLGFQQKGRSRLWLADHGTWLNVVEFTPSRWSKGVSLMNAAHWLWLGAGFMSFNVVFSSKCHAEFQTEDQFRTASDEIARAARAKALEIDTMFPSFNAIANFVVEQARSSPDRMGPSWWGYEAGVASGLVGRFEEAEWFLRGVTDERVSRLAKPLLPLIKNPNAFKKKVNDMVAQERARLKLPPLNHEPF